MSYWFSVFLVATGLLASPVASFAANDVPTLDTQVKRFWTAEVQQDWGVVYDLSPPADRGKMTRDQYAVFRHERGPYNYLTAQVVEVLVDGDFAWARVRYEFRLPLYPDVAPRAGETWHRWQKTADGWRPVARDELPQWPRLPPQRRPAAEEAALTERANGFWRAKVGRDWKTVYGYLTPDFRAEIPLEEFLKGRVKYLYLSPRIEWTEVEERDGRTKVVYAYKFADPAATKQEPIKRTAVEKWTKVDGQWYYDFRENQGF